ncbi:SDR family NAD(P)-dependent oxidoreductase [Nocardia gamkensis]|uniref:SDR family NAD(P)-dependent oxidoreductase n=1 Tax=Nocardia gamkensis TaxID=352869 RepID=UPI0037CC17A2
MPIRQLSLEGRVAIVTGGGHGLGLEIARSLRSAGSSVVISGRDKQVLVEAERELDPHGCAVVSMYCDVRDEDAVHGMTAFALERFGRVDVLVNNSGIAGPTAPVSRSETAAWRETVETNLLGTYMCCRAVLPIMISQGSGSIVNIGSMTAKRPLFGRSSYAASKSALLGFTRTLALEVGPCGIRVNLVSPGPLEGERIEHVFAAQARTRGITVEEARAEMTSDSPMDRLTPPHDVAAAVAFLVSDAAASITGEDLNVSAGIVMH